LEYKLESETNIGFTLLINTTTPSSPFSSMSQHDLHAIIYQQQEQLAAMQVQIQVLLAGGIERGEERSYREVAKLSVFSREAEKVSGFVIACKLYIKARIVGVIVKEQVQWVLSFIQRESVDIWKENVLEDLEEEVLEYESVGEFLAAIKKEFEGGEEELVKVAELKKLEQGGRLIKKICTEVQKGNERKWVQEEAVDRRI